MKKKLVEALSRIEAEINKGKDATMLSEVRMSIKKSLQIASKVLTMYHSRKTRKESKKGDKKDKVKTT